MADDDTPEVTHVISDPNNEQVKFVSILGNSGFVNGVVNLTYLTARYTATEMPGKALPDLIVAALLRMDLRCAIETYEALGAIIQQNTEPRRTQ